jgi:hypothetical protein
VQDGQVSRNGDHSLLRVTRVAAALTRGREHLKSSGWRWAVQRFPFLSSCMVGGAVGIGFGNSDCGLHWWRGGSPCAAHVAGEGTLIGGLLAGVVAVAASWVVLAYFPRRRPDKSGAAEGRSGWRIALTGLGGLLEGAFPLDGVFIGWSEFGNRHAAWVRLEGKLPPAMDGLSREVLVVPLWAEFQLDIEPLRWPVPVKVFSLSAGREGPAKPENVNGRWNASLLSRLP